MESVTTESISTTELVTTESVTTEISNDGFHSYGSRRYSQVAMFKKGRCKKCLCSRAAHSRETLTHYANLPLILFSLTHYANLPLIFNFHYWIWKVKREQGVMTAEKEKQRAFIWRWEMPLQWWAVVTIFWSSPSTHCCEPARQWLKSNEYVVSNWIRTYPDHLYKL
jgi:hypothetical protein